MGMQTAFEFTFAPHRCAPIALASLGHNGGPALDPVPVLIPGAPKSFIGNFCACGAPISSTSRGRCWPCSSAAKRRPIPADFMEILRKKGSLGAAAHYRSSAATITRWRRQMDLRPHARAKKGAPSNGGRWRSRGFRETLQTTHRDMSVVGQAVEFLRRIGPVFRCLITGVASDKGEFWNRNGWVLTDEDIVSRATRLGWAVAEL